MKLDQLTLEGIWSKDQWSKELSNSCRLCLGIENDSDLIAFGCGWLVVDELQLTVIAVHPNFRRQGIAKRIVFALFKEAQQKGIKTATLEVNIQNQAAIGLYQACGFRTKGKRIKYYKNEHDALIQSRDISSL